MALDGGEDEEGEEDDEDVRHTAEQEQAVQAFARGGDGPRVAGGAIDRVDPGLGSGGEMDTAGGWRGLCGQGREAGGG